MAAVESEQEPNTIVAILQKGYTLHDRVVRPALVSVAKAKATPPMTKLVSRQGMASAVQPK